MLLTAMEYLRDEDAVRNFCGSQKKSEKVENDIDFETSQPSPDQENRSDTKSKEWLKRLKFLGEKTLTDTSSLKPLQRIRFFRELFFSSGLSTFLLPPSYMSSDGNCGHQCFGIDLRCFLVF